jgi:hypothetical protein
MIRAQSKLKQMHQEDSHTHITVSGHRERLVRYKGKHHHALGVGFILQHVRRRARNISREDTTLAYTASQTVWRKEVTGIIPEKCASPFQLILVNIFPDNIDENGKGHGRVRRSAVILALPVHIELRRRQVRVTHQHIPHFIPRAVMVLTHALRKIKEDTHRKERVRGQPRSSCVHAHLNRRARSRTRPPKLLGFGELLSRLIHRPSVITIYHRGAALARSNSR